MSKDVTRTNRHFRKHVVRQRSRRDFARGADRTHVVNSALTPAMSQRGGIRL